MKKRITDENNGLDYLLINDVYYLILIMEHDRSFDKYGNMRLDYLVEHKEELYTELMVSECLYDT